MNCYNNCKGIFLILIYTEERNMTTSYIFSGSPTTHRDAHVVIYMKKGYLILFFSEYEKNCVQQIKYLKHEIHPYYSGNLFGQI